MHPPRARPQRHNRVDEEVERENHISGDIDLDEGVIQAIDVDLWGADGDEHVDRVQRAEDDEREPRLAIGQLGDVEQVIDVIGERAIPLPGIERPSLGEPLELPLALALSLRFLVGVGDAHAAALCLGWV